MRPFDGSNGSLMPWPPEVRFYLDECFPEQIAVALSTVGYPITWPSAHGKTGAKDPDLIPWLAEQRYAWVTRDDAARRAHAPLIRKSRLSVLWVRGVERTRGSVEKNVSMHDVHLMLTTKLTEFAERVASARSPRHAMVYLNGDRPKLDRVDMQQVAPGHPIKIVGKW